MPRLIALVICVATLILAAPAHAQAPYYPRVATIGPYAPTDFGWAPRFGTYYNPYVAPSYAYAAGWAYGGGYGAAYDPTAWELRRLRYAVEDVAYAPRPLPPLRPAFRPGPRPSGFDLPSRRGR